MASNNDENVYECALTEEQEDGIDTDVEDGLGDLPAGWTRIQMSRRVVNPRWLQIQLVKEGLINTIVEQFPPEQQDEQRGVISIQIDAQFHGIESTTPTFVLDIDDVVYLSPNAEVYETLNEVRGNLGLEPVSPPDEGDEDEASGS